MTRITNYITEAFADVPRTNNAMELQEELISNLTEKYNDQLSLGKTEDEAYSAVISSIGDLSELTEGLKARHVLSPESPEERKKSARHIAIAVMLFILSPAALILTANLFDQGVIGLVIMFAFIAAGVGLLIYNSASKPSYLKENESLIEEFKEFKAAKNKNKGMHDSLIVALWMIAVAIYFFYSFTYGTWAFSWVIFIIAVAVQNLLEALWAWRQSHEK